jgi:DNA-binding LacI/PurR family transcriptional regulator
MRVTLNDIARKVGVTKAAVSVALRGKPGVSEGMRETIRRVAAEMGYVPDPILQRLTSYRGGGKTADFQSAIAWINHWPNSSQLRAFREFEQYFRGASAAARRQGYRLEEFIWPSGMSAAQAERELVQLGVLGLLLPPHPPNVDWGGFAWTRFSLIRFGLSVRKPDSNLVSADHQRAIIMAMHRIFGHGYRRIGLVYNQAHDRSMGGGYLGGFLYAHKLLAGLELVPPLDSEISTARAAAGSRRRFEKWMARYQPEAVLTARPETISFLRELGLRVPQDVAVAGTSIHDIEVDAGVDQCPGDIGQIAAEMLIKQISLNERGEPPEPARILVESRWRDGGSLPGRG